ncbi:MAG: glycosyltransferase family 4 protein [Gammaproteobacteria bacterium]|nr:glycosyltransferase family 4 protein [Gammaproteobacteria bacterium]
MPHSLKILVIVHNQTCKGGAYYRGLNLAKPLIRRGHDVTLMTIHPTARWHMVERKLEGVRLVESPDLLWGAGRSGWDPWDTLRRTLWLKGRRFDIIHTVDTRPAVVVPAMLARKANGAKWVADWTDWWGRGGATEERPGWAVRTFIGPIEQLFEERPRPHADATVVISRALGRRALELGIAEDRILYLPPGADPDAIRDTPRAKVRELLGLEPEGRYVGYLGNIYQRDADLLFKTLTCLKATDAKLIMVGEPGCQVPPEVEHRVQVTGRVSFSEMLDFLSACDVVALPLSDTVANRGRWPSKVNEFVAVGRPTVACDVGDVADLLRDNEIGLLVKPDPADFAAKIDSLLGDPERARAMGDRAREVARTTYSQDAAGDKLESFYYRTLASEPELAQRVA